MGTIWTRDNGGALTGTQRIGADKGNSGNSADSVHYTTEQLADFGESQHAAVPRPADANTLLSLDAIADVANSAANTATIANAAADNAQAAADDAQTTADTAAAAAVAAQDAVDAITPASIGAATVAEAGNALTAAQNAQNTADDAATAATAAQGTADNAVAAAGIAQATADGAATAASTHSARTDNPHSTTAAQVGADPKTTVQTAHTAATLTLANADNNQHRALNTASNSIAISIPDTLAFPFVWTARKSSASNSVTITTGAGLITPKASGTVPVTAVDAWITVFAESSTVAAVFVTVAT